MSKLRRSFSDVFRNKKAARDPPGFLPGIAEHERPAPYTERRRPVADVFNDEAAISTFGTLVQEEDQLQEAVMESLRDRNRTLEQEKNLQSAKAVRVEQQLRAKADEAERLQQHLNQLGRERDRARQSEATIQRLRQDSARVEEENAQLTRQMVELRQQAQQVPELKQNLKEYQASIMRISEAHTQLQDENRALLESNDSPADRIKQDKIRLRRKVRALEAEIARGRDERENRDRALADLHNQQDQINERNKELADRLAMLVNENEVVKADLSRQIRQLELQQQQHDVEMAEAIRVPWSDPTPRMVLINDIFSQGFQRAIAAADEPNAAPFLASCNMAMLTNNLLDVQLSQQQARRFAENITSNDLTILACNMCQLPKFAQRPNAQTRFRVNEFARTSQPTGCCSKFICTNCHLEAVTKSLTSGWWTKLGTKNWFKCPAAGCDNPLPLTHRAALENLLRQLGDRDTENNMAMYDRIMTFRSALSRLDPRPSETALQVAADLHVQLATVGRMYSLFDPMFTNTEPDDAGRIPPFNPGNIRMIKVDHGGASITVPLFIRFIRRQRTPKECAVCTDEFFDVDFSSLEEWLDLCAGFHGEWMWKILLFPVKLGLECTHEIDFCTGCLQQHLKTQLEQYGRSRCDQLACPSDGCGRRLAYGEIQLYAEADTFEEYDRYLHLNALSRFPSFRWCLGAGCSNGQLYDEEGVLDPQIRCEECGFEMCYNHSMPWHEGQTCEQYDSMRHHGDPEFQQTQDWITNNTKPCPSCRENIQKGEYCFHMTCSSCHFEFCWECLADWGQISPSPGQHNQNAHGEGCPFRINGLTPTQISGTSLPDALRRRRR